MRLRMIWDYELNGRRLRPGQIIDVDVYDATRLMNDGKAEPVLAVPETCCLYPAEAVILPRPRMGVKRNG